MSHESFNVRPANLSVKTATMETFGREKECLQNLCDLLITNNFNNFVDLKLHTKRIIFI